MVAGLKERFKGFALQTTVWHDGGVSGEGGIKKPLEGFLAQGVFGRFW